MDDVCTPLAIPINKHGISSRLDLLQPRLCAACEERQSSRLQDLRTQERVSKENDKLCVACEGLVERALGFKANQISAMNSPSYNEPDVSTPR